jgi:hypothetical protein
MSFQFTCPQGHLLEGDPAHAGMQSQCPLCGSMFIIPQPPAVDPYGAVAPQWSPGPGTAAPEVPGAPIPQLNVDPPQPSLPGEQTAGQLVVDAPQQSPPEEDPDRIVHILCPNGHELETPMSMIGSDAMCPHCEAQFQLRYEDSREYQEQKAKEREQREAAFGRKALQWAIAAAALVVIGLLALILVSSRQ